MARSVNDRTEPNATAFGGQISHDLDAICLKALRPDPEARYPSAEQLGQDIERHLEGQPVRARAATLGYRTGFFVRRHHGGVTIAVALTALELLGLAREMSLRNEAERARRDAEALIRRVLEIRTLTLGNDHPSTIEAAKLVEESL